MDASRSATNWPGLFGLPDTKEADQGRSVLSPAAYLADLLQLLEDRFAGSDLLERRPDITKQLPLNGEQSFSLVRQLDIVNRVLADRISRLKQAPADEVLASAVHPFLLPFDGEHARLRQLLLLLRTPFRALHESFTREPDVDVLAREQLGLSPMQAAVLVTDLSGDAVALAAAYGLAPDETLGSLQLLERLKRATQLDGPLLRDLLFSQLSSSRDPLGRGERDAAGQLFIHHDLDGFAALDPGEQHLIWNGAQEPIPAAWFDRVHRLLCLSRWTGITLGVLDLTLRQLCDYTLDRKALRRLAVLVDLRERTGASLEQLCALISELDGDAALGAGDDPKQAASLFDQVYNADAARIAKRYVPSGSAYVPPAYQSFAPLRASGDVLLDADFNKDLRARIQSALGISSRDLTALITRLRERAAARGRVSRLASLDSRGLSILHRIARLAELVDLSPLDFLRLLDVLQHDSSLKVQNAFDVLDPQQLAQADLYEVLERGSVSERLWLVQNVVAVAAWAAAAALLPEDLEAAAIVPDPALPAQQAELIATSSALREALVATALTAEALTTAEITPRVARLALATIGTIGTIGTVGTVGMIGTIATTRDPKRRLVAPSDARLVTWDAQAAQAAAYATVHTLEVVSVDDLATLGLGADLADYLQFLLVRRGVLDVDGLLRDNGLPSQPAGLVLESVDAERVARVFDLLHEQYLSTTGSGSEAQAALEDLSVLEEAASGSDAWSLGEEAETNAGRPPASDDALDALDALDAEAQAVDDEASADTTSEDALANATAEEAAADESESSVAEQAQTAEPEQVEISLYPADLLSLGFSALEADEQLVRLSVLGVLEPSGLVRDPAWFADVAHRNSLPTQVGLDEFRAEIHGLLAETLGRWQRAALQLPQDIWDALPLTSAERDALEQNLVFNGYIDAKRRIVDKTKLAALTAETFDLTLPLYRQRRAILAALQGVVTAARDQYLYVGVDELRALADRIVAIQAHRALASAGVLDERGRIGAQVLPQLDRETPQFELGAQYSGATQQQLWSLLRQVADESKAFRLTDAALASVDLDGEHVSEVIISLCATGNLQPDRSLSPEQVARLRVVHSIKDFELPAYADYARDVFFLVHDVAVATDTAVTALTTALGGVAAAQQTALLEALGSRLELDAETTHAMLRALLHDEAHPIVTLAARATLAPAAEEDSSAAPQDRGFCVTLGRLRAFASFARKLQMTPRQVEAAFGDQQLVEKFPEALVLPTGIDAIDALWTAPNGKIHLFRGAQYWVFDAATRLVLEQARPLPLPLPLTALSPNFKDLTAVDAVYVLPSGEHWLLAGGRAFRRSGEHWLEVSRVWGRVHSRFEASARIECALHDHEGRLHLFCGDQYVRYSSTPQAFVDEGYPRKIAPHWAQELGLGQLPQDFSEGVDAALSRNDEVTWLFKGDRFVASHDPAVAHDILGTWGHVRNNLASASRVDAVFDLGGRCAIVVGDQVSVFGSGLENDGTSADAGYPRTLAVVLGGLPDELAHGFDASLRDEDGTLHLFRDQTCATQGEPWTTAPTRERWGRVRNQLQETGRVDAAFAGLDGRVYLFSGNQYTRYSGADLTRADEGYPRTISRDWAGLTSVDTAFVLDGKTYLFGSDPYNRFHVRYSTRDYTLVDAGYPKPVDENWWNLPAALIQQSFNEPDAVFVAPDGRIHLFRAEQTIVFDHNHRWWSEPTPIQQAWNSLPLRTVSAAFVAKDGRSYLFSSAGTPQFVRYTDPSFQKVDDRFPKPVKEHWGKVVNNLERTGRVDAAVSLVSTVSEVAADGTVTLRKVRYRYLFSGDQFSRYSSDQQAFVDEGYPLRIQSNLHREPHFVHLDAPAERGIDGLWADSGNVYVFIGDRIYAASTAHVRELEGLGVSGARAADVEEGRLCVRGDAGWQRILPHEAHARSTEPAMPHVLRGVPAPFQAATTAILRGLDRNVYMFAGGQCYDLALARQYPIGASWGRVRNAIAEDERVDAALMGSDGKLYLFRRDQFVSYTPAAATPTTLPDVADSTPLPVASRWGGLSDVRHAFVQKGVTYLLESPGQDGTFRYVRYFGADYGRPNEPIPLSGDFAFWKIPAKYIKAGFDRVDAVVAEGDDLLLIRDEQFLHYEASTDTWTYPRPLTLRWPELPQRHPDFESVRACVRAVDGQTYFFGEGAWLSHDGQRPSAWSAISARWGHLRNRIAASHRVDATLVHGDQTFLFSGDEYVRYTGSDYQYVDAGYPRAIAGGLRQESAFSQLPADIEVTFEQKQPEDVWVETAFYAGRSVHVLVSGRSFALSAQLTASYPLSQVARVRNELRRRARVDAAFSTSIGTLLLLSGDQYVRYSGVDLAAVDDGYPRAIADGLLRELADGPAQLPAEFCYDLDASLYDGDGTLVLFKGEQFVRFDPRAAQNVLVPQPIKATWGRVSNPFLPSAVDPRPRIDAAFVAPDGALYVFKGGQYLRYADPSAELADEGYPRAIRDQWGDLPSDFESGIDGAFVFDTRTYLCLAQRYVRYGDPTYGTMDATYPQPFTTRFRASNDFLLHDLRTIQRYVALDQRHPSDDASLTDFLLSRPREKVDPYALLASLFDWEVGELQWLKRRDAFLARGPREVSAEVHFSIEQVLRIYDTLELARRLGSHPQELYERVWLPLYSHTRTPGAAADALERILLTRYPGEDGQRIERQLADALSIARRDAQVAWLVAHSPEGLSDARQLSTRVLTDVEIDASVEGSAVTEAIGAIQLYFHRYLLNLETVASAGDDQLRRAAFKAEWQWLKHYRVWEANRKVFLFAESYIRPELRDTRTAAFKALQDDLHQAEISEASVTHAYKKYLDEYTEVSRLIIAGGYVQPDPRNVDDTELTLFGTTRTEPRRYYHRTATFKAGASSTAVWRAWRKLDIDIPATQVFPVRAFGRSFVFWSAVEQKPVDTSESLTLTTVTDGSTQKLQAEQRTQYSLKVSYSFYDLNEQWTPAQPLCTSDLEPVPIENPRLRVSCAQAGEGESAIEVNFEYSVADPARANVLGARRLRADLTVSSANAVAVRDARADKLGTLFAPGELDLNLELDRVAVMGAADQADSPWYSFDLKGGSFLARPLDLSSAEERLQGKLMPLAGNLDGLPAWDRVDTCLDTTEGKRYLFHKQRRVYRELSDPTERATAERWGLRYTKVHAEQRVDAAWQRNGVAFLARGDRYLKYSSGLEWVDEPGDLGTSADRTRDHVPSWTSLDAAFTDAANNTWFFSGDKYLSLNAANVLSAELPTSAQWGLERNDFSAPSAGGPVVTAAFTRNGRSYLVGPASYTWYAEADMRLCERPRPQSLRAVLVELGCSNATDVSENVRITSVVDSDGELSFRAGVGDDSDLYVLKGNKVSKTDSRKLVEKIFAAFLHRGDGFSLVQSKAGMALLLANGKERREIAQDVRAAFVGLDGKLYLFAADRYLQLAPDDTNIAEAIENWSKRSAPIAARWGRVRNALTEQGRVGAAFMRGNATFLVSGTAYVRYSGTDYSFVDAAYPRALTGNPDQLPETPPDAAFEVGGSLCYFIGTEHVFDGALSQRRSNAARWGRLRSNLLSRGPDVAYRVDDKHYLWSGNELACYTAGPDGTLPAYMDGVPANSAMGTFSGVTGAFVHKGFMYLVGETGFVCCAVDQPEQPLAGYPRTGQARALIADLRQRFALPPASDNIAEGQAVHALLLLPGALLLDTELQGPGRRLLRFDLTTGELSRDWSLLPILWPVLRLPGATYVDVPSARYSFRGARFIKTARGVEAKWREGDDSRSVVSVWGGPPFDVAITAGETVYLFDDGRYTTLSKRDASDPAVARVAQNLAHALATTRPIRGSFTRFPPELLDGFDSALPLGDSLLLFKDSRYLRLRAIPRESTAIKYELIRLTTSTAAYLNEALFAGGLPKLLSLRTQEVDETPGFSVNASGPTTIRVSSENVSVATLPRDGQLDFGSANGIYLWEIFFHAPFLIAETLSLAQRFEQARSWYEHVFDPTEATSAWKFLPFLTVDVESLVLQIEDRLKRLENAKLDIATLRQALSGPAVQLLAMDAAFQGERELSSAELASLDALKPLASVVAAPLAAVLARPEAEVKTLGSDLRELVDMLAALRTRWDSMQASRNAQLDAYLNDPFDPHAIAAQRPIAYRKAIVMRYLNNLLEWGDMLFSQYTRESLDEARMLYMRAWDLLGRRAESLGRKQLPADTSYLGLRDARSGQYDMLLQLKSNVAADAQLSFAGLVANDSLAQPYFFIPANEELERYWIRVADRLYKIRHGLNLQGVRQSLALFEPPLDPMALVRAVAGAGGLAGLVEGTAAVEVPHYRFSFLLGKAQALAQKVSQLGSELLAALEKRDAEALSQLQQRQEGVLLALTRDLRRSQLEEAKANLASLQAAKKNAEKRRDTYKHWIDSGLSPAEQAQIGLMSAGAALSTAAGVVHVLSAIAHAFPKAHLGFFTTGIDAPDVQESINKGAEALSAFGEGLQVAGEVAGIMAQQERSVEEWTLQRELAKLDLQQIEAQINGAEWQVEGAKQQIALAEREIEHNAAIARFYRDKFANQALYDWMAGRLSELHYQSYQLAMSMARAAERAFQFERGSTQEAISFIQGQSWDSQKRGLLAGSSLSLDLDRLEAAYIAGDARRFEITKRISLLEHDPMAFLKLKSEGACELELGEALFDYDFPGHYCRQIKTIGMDIDFGQGVFVSATLTQLTNRVVVEADPKAVAFLLEPTETPPLTIRSNWKALQQVALSHHGEYEPNNGLFELRFDTERFLPFEGTGAVSRWRLELGGRPGSYDLNSLASVSIQLKYTALQGGAAFGAAVRGLLKPTDTLRVFDLKTDFKDLFEAFLANTENVLELPLYTDYFPSMASGRIRAIFTRYETATPGAASFVIDMGQQLALPNAKTVDTTGLTVRARGTALRLRVKGDKTLLGNAYLVMSYKAGA